MSLDERARLQFTAPELREAYNNAFRGPSGSLVLAHLADACHATATTARDTAAESDRAEGRRQVWLVIQSMLSMTEKDIRDMQEEVASRGD